MPKKIKYVNYVTTFEVGWYGRSVKNQSKTDLS